MNILGIIAEFNPLHTGHAHLIRHLRRETGAAFCVVVMSGDYVQRGEPAFFSKHLRTEAALLCGADLVLELPLSVSTGSAEYFARGAVSLLENLSCITHLGFGSECGDIAAFRHAGKILSEEPAAFQDMLQHNLKTGMSFPKARYESLRALPPDESKEKPAADQIPAVFSLLESPNNILGTEYCKALYQLDSPITPVTIKRLGAGYHEETTAHQYASASGLRKAFLTSRDEEETKALLQRYVPCACHALYLEALKQKQYVTFDDFFLPLYHTLLYSDGAALSRYQDVSPEFSERLLRVFRQCSSTAELCAAMKTRHLTFARISRALLHILLRLTKDTAAAQKEQETALYARILGFRRQAQPLLTRIKSRSHIPLVSKLADAPKSLSPLALAQLDSTIKASELYRAVLPGTCPGSEYSQPVIIL